ncbi:MAG: hypothetical protein CMH69_14865 [Nitratireductor sp.]|nr:hypothetical protein [Nitratireductor sp.]
MVPRKFRVTAIPLKEPNGTDIVRLDRLFRGWVGMTGSGLGLLSPGLPVCEWRVVLFNSVHRIGFPSIRLLQLAFRPLG